MRFTAILVLAGAAASASAVFIDDFNRADAADLGPNYDIIGTGSATRTISNEAGNVAGANNLSLVKSGVFTGAYDMTTVSADVRVTDQTSALNYVALALGHDGSTTSGHGLFIKVQRQLAGGFSHLGFYTAVGTSNSSAITGGATFFALTTRFDAARMYIWASDPTTINCGFDTNFDTVLDQVHTRTMVLGPLVVGDRVGIGVYGTTGRADNFRADVVPEPATILALGAGLAALIRRRKN